MIFVIKTDDEVAGLDITAALSRAGISHTIISKANDEAAQQGVQSDGAYCDCKDYIAKPNVTLSVCGICEKPRR